MADGGMFMLLLAMLIDDSVVAVVGVDSPMVIDAITDGVLLVADSLVDTLAITMVTISDDNLLDFVIAAVSRCPVQRYAAVLQDSRCKFGSARCPYRTMLMRLRIRSEQGDAFRVPVSGM